MAIETSFIVFLTRSRNGCSVVVVVAEGRGKQRGRQSGSAVVNPSNRTQRERMARDTRQELVHCVQQEAMVR